MQGQILILLIHYAMSTMHLVYELYTLYNDIKENLLVFTLFPY
jgi:hypothetical protein